MNLFGSKKIEELRAENEELKTKFHFMYEKDEKGKKLEEVLKYHRKAKQFWQQKLTLANTD